jgi:integrase
LRTEWQQERDGLKRVLFSLRGLERQSTRDTSSVILDPLLTKAELPHFRVHDLRHFCASLLLAQGVPLIKVVSDLLGHTQISITADLYTHVLPAVRKEAIDLMDRILMGAK